ncbi:hypothetical protein G7092_14430 [Mucilaginibacter sp. HC2]|uniref:hypothetical protein n=1 Tax=Mucilaginibacter inviolabilis TaxID=2714892 RepID=UPI0014095FA9|nr:hypothetical protein [Mucilaginibacter inviolabilis]NHA05004.1 hypothetical protein [Mucilaginibacter inviolabilis]
MKKNLPLIICLIIALLFIRLVFFIKNTGDRDVKSMQNENVTISQTIPVDYGDLFKYKNNLSSDGTINTRFRNAVADIRYDNKYFIQVYKIDTSFNHSLSDFITESHQDKHITYDQSYREINDHKLFSISYKVGQPEKISAIFLNIFGNDAQTIEKRDSIAGYYSDLKNLSIQYGQNQAQDIYIKPKDDKASMPISIYFIKKNQALYLIILTAINNEPVTSTTLKELLAK